MATRSKVIACALAPLISVPAIAVVIETVTVGNAGNAGEWSGESYGGYGPDRICGAVDYTYSIGKYEVTAGQYTEFLNAVAATDTYGLYNGNMAYTGHPILGCSIVRNGAPGSYTYSVAADWADRPVNYVSWGDAARFCNWMHNGQPTAPQGPGTTEDGSYLLAGAMTDWDLLNVAREGDATWVIPSEDEWFKAAYHKNDGVMANYFDYPSSSDSMPGYVNDAGNLSGTATPFVEGGSDPGNYATYDGDSGTNGIGCPYYFSEVGEWENSGSPYGTFDQGGNLAEWNEAVLDVFPIGLSRGWRGGSFYYFGDELQATHRYGTAPRTEWYGMGFRLSIRHGGPGDMNCDAAVDVFDINPFVDALLDLDSYQAKYPGCDFMNGDINGDDVVDVFDINPFVDLLLGG